MSLLWRIASITFLVTTTHLAVAQGDWEPDKASPEAGAILYSTKGRVFDYEKAPPANPHDFYVLMSERLNGAKQRLKHLEIFSSELSIQNPGFGRLESDVDEVYTLLEAMFRPDRREMEELQSLITQKCDGIIQRLDVLDRDLSNAP